jgi:hypothetical protein
VQTSLAEIASGRVSVLEKVLQIEKELEFASTKEASGWHKKYIQYLRGRLVQMEEEKEISEAEDAAVAAEIAALLAGEFAESDVESMEVPQLPLQKQRQEKQTNLGGDVSSRGSVLAKILLIERELELASTQNARMLHTKHIQYLRGRLVQVEEDEELSAAEDAAVAAEFAALMAGGSCGVRRCCREAEADEEEERAPTLSAFRRGLSVHRGLSSARMALFCC